MLNCDCYVCLRPVNLSLTERSVADVFHLHESLFEQSNPTQMLAMRIELNDSFVRTWDQIQFPLDLNIYIYIYIYIRIYIYLRPQSINQPINQFIHSLITFLLNKSWYTPKHNTRNDSIVTIWNINIKRQEIEISQPVSESINQSINWPKSIKFSEQKK